MGQIYYIYYIFLTKQNIGHFCDLLSWYCKGSVLNLELLNLDFFANKFVLQGIKGIILEMVSNIPLKINYAIKIGNSRKVFCFITNKEIYYTGENDS